MLCSCNNSSTSDKNRSEASSSKEVSNNQGNLSDEDMVKGEFDKLLSDIANQKIEKFQWFTKDFILKTFGEEWLSKVDDNHMLKAIVNYPEQMPQEVRRYMKGINDECVENGFNWTNYSIESIRIEDKKEEIINDVKIVIYRGSFKVKSNEKVFDFVFDDLVVMDGAARFVEGFGLDSEE